VSFEILIADLRECRRKVKSGGKVQTPPQGNKHTHSASKHSNLDKGVKLCDFPRLSNEDTPDDTSKMFVSS
jgi:hypothetical protein